MVCDLIDFRCMFVSELIGNAALAMVILLILYFIVASKLRWGFKTTLMLGFASALIFSLAIAGFGVLYAFLTLLAGFMLYKLIMKLTSKSTISS